MILIHLYFVFLILQCHGIRGDSHVLIRAGLNATLSCEKTSRFPTITCSHVSWLFNNDSRSSVFKVRNGQVSEEHPGSSRLTVNSECSLNIHNVSAEDAGQYTCRLLDRTDLDSRVDLGVLSISAAPPGGSSNPEADVTVHCSVSRFGNRCSRDRILWLDQNRKTVSRNSPNNCVSTLTLSRHDNRRFTCQYVNAKGAVISADYTAGVSPDTVHLYSRAGDDVTLPCDGLRDRGPTCSDVDWQFYKRPSSIPTYKVAKGVVQDSGSSRMSLNSDCSLSLYDVTEDESGAFHCQLRTEIRIFTSVFLNVLAVAPVPVDPNQTPDGTITLRCSLGSYDPLCERGNFRWFNQSQTVLPAFTTNCVSYLTVERQSPRDRTFTCQFVERNEVKISAEYRLEGENQRVQPPNPEDGDQTRGNCEESKGWSWFLVLKTVGWSALISATVVVSICTREKGKPKRSSGDFEMVCSPDVGPGNTAPPADYENQP